MKATLFVLFAAVSAFAYPGGVEKIEVKIPEVEKWKVSDTKPPTHNYSAIRLSKTGSALRPSDPREPVMESVFYEDPSRLGEFGAIYRAKNEKGEWVVFARCWGIKKVDGQWEQDIDKDSNGVPDDNGHVNWAILNHEGKWCAGIEGETIFSFSTCWHDYDAKDYVEGIRYAIAGKDNTDPDGVFLYTGRVMMVAPEPAPPDEDDK